MCIRDRQKWAVLGGRFGKLATCYWVSAGHVPRFTPPEGSFVNFLAQMTNTVLRSRREKSGATAQPAPAARIALPSRSARAIEISTVLSHDLRCIPTSLAKKIYAGAMLKGIEGWLPPGKNMRHCQPLSQGLPDDADEPACLCFSAKLKCLFALTVASILR